MKYILIMSLCVLAMSCGSSSSNGKTTEEQVEQNLADSISTEITKSTESLKEETKKAGEEIDQLLEGI